MWKLCKTAEALLYPAAHSSPEFVRTCFRNYKKFTIIIIKVDRDVIASVCSYCLFCRNGDNDFLPWLQQRPFYLYTETIVTVTRLGFDSTEEQQQSTSKYNKMQWHYVKVWSASCLLVFMCVRFVIGLGSGDSSFSLLAISGPALWGRKGGSILSGPIHHQCCVHFVFS